MPLGPNLPTATHLGGIRHVCAVQRSISTSTKSCCHFRFKRAGRRAIIRPSNLPIAKPLRQVRRSCDSHRLSSIFTQVHRHSYISRVRCRAPSQPPTCPLRSFWSDSDVLAIHTDQGRRPPRSTANLVPAIFTVEHPVSLQPAPCEVLEVNATSLRHLSIEVDIHPDPPPFLHQPHSLSSTHSASNSPAAKSSR